MPFLDSLPASMNDPAYQAVVMDNIRKGNFEITWGTVKSEANGHKAEFRVFADALKIEGVRICVSSYMEQQIADLLGCSLLTSKLSDLAWYQRNVTLAPVLLVQTQADLAKMATVAYMLKHSQAVDAQLTALASQGKDTSGIRRDIGKDWLISNVWRDHPNTSINYGDFTTSGGLTACATTYKDDQGNVLPCRVYQPPPERGSWRHGGTNHIDYSQICSLVSRQCFVDNQVMDLRDVLTNPDLAPLASSEGVLKYLRQPGVPELTQLVQRPPCVGPDCPKLVSWEPGGDEFRPSKGPLLLSAAALVLTVGAFFGGLWLMGRTTKGRAQENPYTPQGEGWPKYEYKIVRVNQPTRITFLSGATDTARRGDWLVLGLEKLPGQGPRSAVLSVEYDRESARARAVLNARTRASKDPRNPNRFRVLDETGLCVYAVYGSEDGPIETTCEEEPTYKIHRDSGGIFENPAYPDIDELITAAMKYGWTVDKTSKNHYRFRSPTGKIVVASGTPGDWRAVLDTRARLRREGVKV